MASDSQSSGLRRERTLASAQFRDGKFHNTGDITPGIKRGHGLSMAREMICGNRRRVPVAPLPSVLPFDDWRHPPESGLRATWLGHSTSLIEIDGARLLLDPVWGERVSPLSWAGPKRFQPAPVAIDQLPKLDAVLISHDHYDHLDYPTIVELAKLDVPFYTSLGVGAHLEGWGVAPERITELDWWESVQLKHGIELTAAPAQHFSGRGMLDRNRTLWSAFALRGPDHAVFFSGDTGLTEDYTTIARKLGTFDLVMLEVGAYFEAWGDVHLGPDGAVEAFKLLGSADAAFLPVHWGMFNLAFHDWDQPAERLLQLAPKHDIPLLMPKLGAAVEPAHTDGVDPWWRAITALELPAPKPETPATFQPLPDPID
ncbi:MAG: MBL fold metallo-hydrolase [Planctomycetes bacterium]|nr:MBL fold metallo-hydrolase [Planctomycetota bacterium]